MKITLILIAAFAAGGFMMTSCSSFGSSPGIKELGNIADSPNYDKENERFINRRQDDIDSAWKEVQTFGMAKEFLFGGEDLRTPDEYLPQVKPDILEFTKDNDKLKFIWFGHSSLMVRIGDKNILLDPVFSKYASPVYLVNGRFQPPALELEELPEIDYIVISHDHYDHLDMPTIKFFKDKRTKFLTPLAVGSHLRGWGIDSSRITELNWWQDIKFGDINFTCTPSQHFSGRGFKRNPTLWASWVISNGQYNIYFSGDSGYDTHFKEIGDKLGPFDVAFIENGQYNERWKLIHMIPEHSAQAAIDLKARQMMPIHWGMFNLALHSWYRPAVDIREQADKFNIDLLTPICANLVKISNSYYFAFFDVLLLGN